MKNIVIGLIVVGGLLVCGATSAQAQLGFGDAFNFAALVDNNVQTFQMAGGSTINGNVAIAAPSSGNAPQVSLAGGTINGAIDFAKTYNQGNQQNNTPPNFGGTVTGGYAQNVADVTTVMNIVSSISSTFGSFSGASLAINPSSQSVNPAGYSTKVQTVNATSGTYDAAQNAYVFNVTTLSLNSGDTLKINGTASQNVVINVNDQNGEFNGGIVLSGGLTANDVLINILSNGEFQNATGGATQNVTYVDLYGQNINIENPIVGHFYGGANNGNFQITSGGSITSVVATPEPATWMAGAFVMIPIGISLWRRLHRTPVAP